MSPLFSAGLFTAPVGGLSLVVSLYFGLPFLGTVSAAVLFFGLGLLYAGREKDEGEC